MTLTNICLFIMAICLVRFLEDVVHADERAAKTPREYLAEPKESGLDYLPTEEDSLIHSDLVSAGASDDSGPLLAPDVEDGAPRVQASPRDHPLADAGGAWSQEMNMLLTPMIPNEAMWREQIGGGVAREELHIGLPVTDARHAAGDIGTLGPLAVDIYSISAMALYSKLAGAAARLAPPDGFIAAISLKAAVLLQLSDTAYLRVRATVYYLPVENKAGLYFGSGDTSVASFSYITDIGRWKIQVGDKFSVFHPLSQLLDEYEVDEIAVSGRYRFGRADTLRNRPFTAEDVYFHNIASVNASTWLDDNLKLRLQAGQSDDWNAAGFAHTGQVDHAGAGLFYDSPEGWFMPWITYDRYDMGTSGLIAQDVVAGATIPFSHTLQGYARGGCLWPEGGGGGNPQRFLWELGVVHRINDSLSHSVFGGYNYSVTDFGDGFMGSYGRYTIHYRPPGSSWTLTAFAQEDSDEVSKQKHLVYGASAGLEISSSTNISLSGSSLQVRNPSTELATDGTVARVSVTHRLSPTLSATLSCQFTHYNAPGVASDFHEQMLMFTLTKSF